jgi:hypothetical protein
MSMCLSKSACACASAASQQVYTHRFIDASLLRYLDVCICMCGKAVTSLRCHDESEGVEVTSSLKCTHLR